MLRTYLSTKAPHFALLCLASVAVKPHRSDACSVFSPQGSLLLAANYDWRFGDGIILTNPAGVLKQAFLKDQTTQQLPAQWRSQFSSVTLTQWGQDFPMQGMNSAGLGGAVLVGPAQYPAAGKQGLISEMQWLQYQLDRYASTDDVAEHVEDLGIASISAQLHYFLCDRRRTCMVVEFVNGKAVIHKDASLPVRALTNSAYKWALAAWDQFIQSGGDETQLPTSYASLDRFVRAAWYQQSIDPSSQQMMTQLTDLRGKGWTKWQTVFDLEQNTALVRLAPAERALTFNFNAMFHACNQPVKMQILRTGDRGVWFDYNPAIAQLVFLDAAHDSADFPAELVERMIAYPNTHQCLGPQTNSRK